MSETIYVLRAPLTASRESVMKGIKHDSVLSETLNETKEKIINEGGEIFEEEGNILITSDGYYVAVFESDIKGVVEK